jgi:hypothetical protein
MIQQVFSDAEMGDPGCHLFNYILDKGARTSVRKRQTKVCTPVSVHK